MATALAWVLGIVNAGLGVLHVLWAFGVTFPAANEAALARAVIGRRGVTHMPSTASCLMVAAGFMASAALAMELGHAWDNSPIKLPVAQAGLFVGQIFVLRGMIGVLPAFEHALPEQPFLSLNRRIYSPLSFLIGLGFVVLTLSLPNWSYRLAQFSEWFR